MGTIIQVIADIQTTVDALTNVRSAPSYPPNMLLSGLSAETYPAGGTITANGAGWMQELHTVNIDLVMPAKDLARDLAILWPFLRNIPDGIMDDPSFGGNASTFDSIQYQYIVFEDAGIQYRGYRFTITGIKIQPTLT